MRNWQFEKPGSRLGVRLPGWQRTAGLAAAAVCCVPLTAAAQNEAQGGGLEEIVVTATRRAVSLEKVPISVAAYSQETMDRQSLRSFEDVARLTPGLTFERSTDGNTQSNTISIRGISSGAGTATVGIYIDETPVQIRPDSLSSSNPYPQLFDLERVEILRGPQGTLFGAGSEGGTVRFITPEPSLTKYSVVSRAEVSSTSKGGDSHELGGAIGGPIVEDKLGFRFAAHSRENGGWVDRINWNNGSVIQKDSNFDTTRSARLALKWAPIENLSILPSVYYQDTKINDSSVYWEGYSDEKNHNFINANPVRTPTNDHFTLTGVKIEYEFDWANLISNSSYLDRSNANTFDASTLDLATFTGQGFLTPPRALSHFAAHGDLLDTQKVFTQEVRLQSNDANARFNWLVGAFYQHTEQHSQYYVISPYLDDVLAYIGAPFRLSPFFYQGIYLLHANGDLTNKELAGFLNVDYKLTDKLTLTAGVRVSRNEYENLSVGDGPVLGGHSESTVDSTETPVTPKFGVSYQVNDDNMVYASAAKGYRQGSAVGPINNACQADAIALGLPLTARSIEPDEVWSYELGSKNRLASGRVSLDTSIYRIDWSKIQSGLFLPSCNVPTTANVGDARSQGFDFTANFMATDSTTVGLSVGYSDAEYTTATVGSTGAVIRAKGEPLPVAPWTVSFSGEQVFDLFSQEGYFRADYQHRTKNHKAVRTDFPNAVDPTIPRAPESKNLDLRTGVRLDNGFDVSLFVTNVTNNTPMYSRNRDSLTTFNYRAVTVRPRTVGLTATYRF